MSKLAPALPLFLGLVMASPPLLAQSLTRDAERGRHPYDIALDYCESRGGLAQYSVRGDEVTFSCSDDLTAIITIRS